MTSTVPRVVIDGGKCSDCYECTINCPTGALRLFNGVFEHNGFTCGYCRQCMNGCVEKALIVKRVEV